MRSPRTATKSSPRSPQLEKAHSQQRRPNAVKKKRKEIAHNVVVFEVLIRHLWYTIVWWSFPPLLGLKFKIIKNYSYQSFLSRHGTLAIPRPGSESRLHLVIAMWPWADHLTFLILTYPRVSKKDKIRHTCSSWHIVGAQKCWALQGARVLSLVGKLRLKKKKKERKKRKRNVEP